MLLPRKVFGPERTLRNAQFPAGMVTVLRKILISGGEMGMIVSLDKHEPIYLQLN